MGSCAGRRETAEGEARRFGKAAEYADAMRLVRPHSMSAEGALAAFLHPVSFHLLLLEFCSLSCRRLSSGSKRRSVRFGPALEQYRTLVVFQSTGALSRCAHAVLADLSRPSTHARVRVTPVPTVSAPWTHLPVPSSCLFQRLNVLIAMMLAHQRLATAAADGGPGAHAALAVGWARLPSRLFITVAEAVMRTKT